MYCLQHGYYNRCLPLSRWNISSVFVASYTRALVNPAILEALACREGLALAQDLGMQHIQEASDCKQVVNRIHHEASDCKQVVNRIHHGVGGEDREVIKEIQETLQTVITCNFSFKSRASNVETHNLARFGVSLPQGRQMWLGSPHDPIAIPLNIVIDQHNLASFAQKNAAL